MTLAATVSVGLRTTFTRVAGLGLATYQPEDADLTQIVFADGTAADQADLEYRSAPGGRTLAASTSENLDLAGILADVLGSTVTFAKIKAIKIIASATNVNDVVIGGAASNAFVGPFGASTHTIALKPGDVFLITNRGAGWTVTAGTGDQLKIANSGAGSSVTYDIHIIGTSV